MLTLISLVTSIKDYVEVVHKLIETDPNFHVNTYFDFGSLLTFSILSGKQLIQNLLTFQWFQKCWSIPTLIPDVASAMISEMSVFDGYFQNTQNFLESPISYGNNNFFIYCLEKFMIGLLNSVFLCFPTSIAHIITLRRFVMQGLEAGFYSGLGTIAGNLVWIGSIVFGLRFLVIPWLSLDLFRYFLGFLLIVKYMWDSYTERRMVLEDLSKYKIFFLTFLLSFTEQTTIYPFISNIAIGSDSTILESFPTNNVFEFGIVHFSYLLGILLGSLSLLQFTCWFWENPAFQIYMWFISSFKATTGVYSKLVNLLFLYLTMICAISNIAYFGLDYTLTNPLGFVNEDRLLDQKDLLETSFLNTKASDRNTRRNRGRHGRRERWKRRVRRYRTFDASLYDQGVYDLLTLEDLNYGFDRFWLRRKIRNHRVRFRFFPGPWMRSFKKQLSRPRLESFMGPRVEFFRILFEQAYHTEFHEFSKKKNILKTQQNKSKLLSVDFSKTRENTKIETKSSQGGNQKSQSLNSIYWNPVGTKQQRFLKERATLRKFLRKVNNRIQVAKIQNQIKNPQNLEIALENSQNLTSTIYPKSWKSFSLSEINRGNSPQNSLFEKSQDNFLFQRLYRKIFVKQQNDSKISNLFDAQNIPISSQKIQLNDSLGDKNKSQNDSRKHLSKKDRFLERYKTFLKNNENLVLESNGKNSKTGDIYPSTMSISSNNGNMVALSTSTLANKELNSVSSQRQLASNFEKKENMEKEKNHRVSQMQGQLKSMTLLHPLKFYMQKEQALKKKFQFYGVKLFRNFGVENNAPYFRVMMKRFFSHYKPSLRWERTLRVATMRKAQRKGSRIPRKLNISKNAQILGNIEKDSLLLDEKSFGFRVSDSKMKKSSLDESFMNKPTHFFSLVDKRASRYRYQIYKDVLQHWYYSPLNRLLLKFDVDSFIRRQPNSYFLTKNDEKFLHLKRQLFSEYYDTLRWYTYMEHYSTMKNQIGGTKSLSNRAYNQQFVGTFKKIRHLFNITPSFNDSTVLKFDQPLYNEYPNTQKTPLVQSSLLHEELLNDDLLVLHGGNLKNSNMPEDLPNQSAKILREYLTTAIPIRQEYMKNLLLEKNYWELTKFLFRGQKIRGDRPLTNETDFLNQEQKYLLPQNLKTGKFTPENFKQDMSIALLKKCQNKLYDQEAIKNYVSLKKEKYENQKQKHQKYLKNRLERMKEAFLLQNSLVGNKKEQSKEILSQLQNISGYTSSVQKAMKESILWEKNSLIDSSFQTIDKFFAKKNFLQKTNIRQNRPNIYLSLYKLTNNTELQKNNRNSFEAMYEKTEGKSRFASKINIQKIHAEIFKKTLHNSVKKRVLEIYEAETKLKKNFAQSTNKKVTEKVSFLFKPFVFAKNVLWNTFRFRKVDVFQQNIEDKTQTLPFFKKESKFSNIFRKFSSLFLENSNKNIDFWKKRENALSKRRKIRKTFKRLRNQYTVNDKILFENNDFQTSFDKTKKPSRQKIDRQTSSQENGESEFLKRQKFTNSQSWKKYFSGQTSPIQNLKNPSFFEKISSFQKNFFKKKFQRKRSRLRRYSSFKGRGPIKKRTLREKLKRQFKSLKKYRSSQDNGGTNQLQMEREKKKVELIQLITQRNYEASPLGGKFLKREKKQRRTRQMKHRLWKKKKQNYAQKRRKLRKRRRSTISKIRVFNKKLQRILSKKQIQTWWWQTFLPNFQTMTEKSWQLEKNMQIRKELFELSEKEIFERDQFIQNFENKSLSALSQNFDLDKNLSPNVLQIGDKDFQPLAIPEALRIREKLIQKEMLRFGNSSKLSQNNVFPSLENSKESKNSFSSFSDSFQTKQIQSNVENFGKSLNILDKFTQNVLTPQKTSFNTGNSKLFLGINPIPFYAGWDENSRKFVVTNRLLSRKQCFSCSPQTGKTSLFNKNENNEMNFSEGEFLKAPLRGMNAATTLYWQIPFTTYDPDQFFALGMDGFSPLGWRNFSFKHSKQITKPILVKNFFSFDQPSSLEQNKTSFSKNLQLKFFENTLKQKLVDSKNIFLSNKEIEKNFEYRRIMKKQKRIKKHPRPPVWFPSGSLSQQVLPVHYIYVFYKRSRLPRDRYIRRRLRSNFSKNENNDDSSIFTKITDFTLRKRAKPRRKYHRKRFVFENSQFVLRRRKFRGFFDEKETSRPSSKFFQTSSKQEKRTLKSKQRKKITDSKQNADNLRLRQLRRRVQRQVYRPVWRYRPRAGGFVWPGDYLRLELVKAPQLVCGISEKNLENSKTLTRKIRKKKRRTLQEWQIQPKKYLLEKHNLKVLKKRLEKSSQFNM